MHLHQFDLPLRNIFRISREAISVQPTLIVELKQNGQTGYGEATTNTYYHATISEMVASLEAAREQIESSTLQDPSEFWNAISPQFQQNPFPLCALDQAAHDLWGKLEQQPVYRLWELDIERIPDSNFTIGIDEIEVMISKLQDNAGWPIYKIKLGTANDIEIVRQLRQYTDAIFRVDANCGWTEDETISNSHELKQLGVEFIEQPLPAGRWDEQKSVYNRSALPVIADESCITPEDVGSCGGFFHGVNIKLVKCGGLTPARRMIAEARQLGLKVMVGCMTESTVGISAIAQLLPLLDYVDMDGAALLAEDIARGVEVIHGKCQFASGNGHGVHLVKKHPVSL